MAVSVSTLRTVAQHLLSLHSLKTGLRLASQPARAEVTESRALLRAFAPPELELKENQASFIGAASSRDVVGGFSTRVGGSGSERGAGVGEFSRAPPAVRPVRLSFGA